jgi:hypothetical protein
LRQLLASNVAAVDVALAEDALKRTTGSPPLEVAIAAVCRVVEADGTASTGSRSSYAGGVNSTTTKRGAS